MEKYVLLRELFLCLYVGEDFFLLSTIKYSLFRFSFFSGVSGDLFPSEFLFRQVDFFASFSVKTYLDFTFTTYPSLFLLLPTLSLSLYSQVLLHFSSSLTFLPTHLSPFTFLLPLSPRSLFLLPLYIPPLSPFLSHLLFPPLSLKYLIHLSFPFTSTFPLFQVIFPSRFPHTSTRSSFLQFSLSPPLSHLLFPPLISNYVHYLSFLFTFPLPLFPSILSSSLSSLFRLPLFSPFLCASSCFHFLPLSLSVFSITRPLSATFLLLLTSSDTPPL